MPARLTFYPPDQPVRRFVLDPLREHLIGRGADSDLRIADSRLSRKHAQLGCVAGRWRLKDLGSKNGVELDGRTVAEAFLCDGNWVSFGGLLASFDEVSEERLAAERAHAESRWQTTITLSRRLRAGAPLDELLSEVLGTVLEIAGAERGFVMLADDAGRLTVRAHTGTRGPVSLETRFPGSLSTVQRVLGESHAVVVCDVRADSLLAARPSIVGGEIRALVCLPLAVGKQPTGVLYLDSSAPGKVFTQLDVELLEAFAAHAALVIGVASVRSDIADIAALLPGQMGRNAAADELVRKLQAALPRPARIGVAGEILA